ncbi:enoyl-CoA hydratase [Sporosarcina sp. P37]|uniref:enoyl-CoA hydratase/isomerase family protein n=1 Tax=unclassified Sporosarcina TaxID=2647733 RepID=UPI0009BCB375|nr:MULTISPECIES: enoyl-CoA hydratase [unclassified Sporosarcina]ARD47973.1 enoyl-CoA hydratase [Sporosarcina sp. P33]ARK24498.1 enoyl-CoA hydratase [Sporosarcina sp. P37]PID18373.1 enoyl-CoA hydratase [Sporosarcina sp. P35]
MAYEKYEAISVHVENGVCTVTLNRPEIKNALVQEMRDELMEFFSVVGSDDDVKTIVLTGKESVFSAGGDLKALQNLNSTQVRNRLKTSQGLIRSILNLEKPVIAVVNGVATGAGFSLAVACDIIYAAKSAVFIQGFIKIGVVPDMGSLYFLPRLIGRHRAMEMMLLGEKVQAEQMQKLGVVNAVHEDDSVLDEALITARKLAASPRLAMGLTKRLTNSSVLSDIEDTFELEAFAQGMCFESDDFKEGVQSFFEKRKPVFK